MTQLVTQIIGIVLELIPKDKFKEFVDEILDKIEDKVAQTPNVYDDAIILPLINKVRELLDVPDGNDD